MYEAVLSLTGYDADSDVDLAARIVTGAKAALFAIVLTVRWTCLRSIGVLESFVLAGKAPPRHAVLFLVER
jgi:hypothetical protein